MGPRCSPSASEVRVSRPHHHVQVTCYDGQGSHPVLSRNPRTAAPYSDGAGLGDPPRIDAGRRQARLVVVTGEVEFLVRVALAPAFRREQAHAPSATQPCGVTCSSWAGAARSDTRCPGAPSRPARPGSPHTAGGPLPIRGGRRPAYRSPHENALPHPGRAAGAHRLLRIVRGAGVGRHVRAGGSFAHGASRARLPSARRARRDDDAGGSSRSAAPLA